MPQTCLVGLSIDASDSQVGSTMRQAVLDFLCSHGTIPPYHWIELVKPVSATESEVSCLACGQPDRELGFSFRVGGVGSRKLRLCPRCSFTEDRPSSARPACTRRDHIDVDCGFAIPTACRQALLFAWPAAEDGKPMSTVSIPNYDPNDTVKGCSS